MSDLSSRATAAAPNWLLRRKTVIIGAALLAAGVRGLPLLHPGGLLAFHGYDDGVYYAAADALTFGHVPYRDFVLLHPPGITVVLAPFALLGRMVGDAAGMEVARVAFVLLGGVNAALVALLASRWSRRAAVVAATLYACWWPLVMTERTTMLEPVGTAAVLIALVLLLRPGTVSGRAQLVAGAVVAFGAGIKIWGVVPWVVIACWQGISVGRRAALRILGGGAAALALLLTPFFALAPRDMFDMVVRDQLRRQPHHGSLSYRLLSMFAFGTHPTGLGTALSVLSMIVVAGAAVVCLRQRSAGVCVALLLATLAVLLLSPSYFPHYAEFVLGPAALVAGIGLALVTDRAATVPRLDSAVAAIVIPAIFAAIVTVQQPTEAAFPQAKFDAAAPPGCITSDDPTALILMSRLSPDFRHNCRVAVDVSGITHDRLDLVKNGHEVLRRDNPGWQQYLTNYLTSGRAFVLARLPADQPDRATLRELDARPVLARSGHLVMR